MILYSTGNKSNRVSFVEAVLNAYPIDRGLYFPLHIPKVSKHFLDHLPEYSFPELATYLANLWLEGEIPESEIREICYRAFHFPIPIFPIDSRTYILELFQGPTMAFKDFGARFMAGLLAWIVKDAPRKIIVLTATSGDTGGAVASGFAGVDQVGVVILFPEGKVSPLQRKQLTTLGANIHAVSIKGNFDDCQMLVKEALIDSEIMASAQFCSANSINIARLLPQSFYYFYGCAHVPSYPEPLIFSVPSGNFGNLTAGIFAKEMGLPISNFIAATNQNDSIPQYLKTGEFHAHPSFQTLATAMDVGNPSNFIRLLEIFGQDYKSMGNGIHGFRVSDREILSTIRRVFQENNYVLDPHTAVGLSALNQFRANSRHQNAAIVLGTAHPAKFPETVEGELGISLPLPSQLGDLLGKKEEFITLEPKFNQLKQYLLEKVLLL